MMIREFEARDTDSILDVWSEATAVAHPFLSDSFQAQELINIREIYIPMTQSWVYESENEVCAFISMLKNEIGAVFVLPQFHRRGIGSKLVEFVAELHEELEVEVFEKNQIGRSFYEKHGFELIKQHVHEKTGESLLRLKRSSAASLNRTRKIPG